MSVEKIANKLAANPLQFAIGAAVLLGVVYLLIRKTVSDVADGVGGVFSGENALTEDTAYEGKGAAGTLGAAADTVTGGALSWLGELLGGAAATAKETVSDFFRAGTGDPNVFHTATFPDGSRHSVQDSLVKSDGAFTYQGRAYRLVLEGGKYFARLA